MKRPPRKGWVTWANKIGGALRSIGLGRADLSFDSLVAEARRRSGMTEWASTRALERLQIVLEDLRESAHLNFLGQHVMREFLVRNLGKNLRLQHAHSQDPAIGQVSLARPLFVVGMPRTGTTLLYNLLAMDPQARAPHFWEIANPFPPSDPADVSDPRIPRAEKILQQLTALSLDIPVVHPMAARGPEECFPILESCFFSVSLMQYMPAPRYVRYLFDADAADADEAYLHYKRQLQVMMYRPRRAHWLSKTPAHMFFLDALLRTFPDARVILTHRDPQRAVPSLASLVRVMRAVCTEDLDPHAIGAECYELHKTVSKRASAVRSAHPDAFHDVEYGDLVNDPIATVRLVYKRLDYPMTPEFEAGMRAWLQANPQGKHGSHIYDPSQFGLDRARLSQM